MADARQALTEAEKMACVPGIWFADTPSGRMATVEGTGLGVWEILRNYEPHERTRARLAEWFDWLADWQLDAALRYAVEFPDEVQARIDLDNRVEAAMMRKQSWTGQEIVELLDSLGIDDPQ